MHITSRKLLLIFILPLFFFGSLPLSVLALSSGGVGGYPAYPDPDVRFSESWFIYNLGRGEVKDDAIIIVNTSDQEHTVKLYPVDSIPSNQGNFALKKEEEPRVGMGAWIELDQDVVTLEPGESERVDFTITIPEAVDVGEHSGGIIIQKFKPGEVSGTGASIVTRVGVRIYNIVPGEIIRRVRLEDFSVTRQDPEHKDPFYNIMLTAFNESNITLSPLSTLIIKGWGKTEYLKKSETDSGEVVVNLGDIFNFTIEEASSREWQLLRDSKVTTRWEWPEPVFGRYTFQVRVEYEGEEGAMETLYTPEVTVWVIPWVELGVLAFIILLIILIIVFKKLVFGTGKWQAYKVKKGEDLFDLAEQANVKWEKIVKANKLKAPKVRAGQVILVPPVLITEELSEEEIIKVKVKPKADTKKATKKVAAKKSVESASKQAKKAIPKKKPVDVVIEIPDKRIPKKWIIIGVVIIVLVFVGIILTITLNKQIQDSIPVSNAPAAQESAAEDSAIEEPVGLQPSEISVGIYEPNESITPHTKLMEKYLREQGFQVKVITELADPEAASQLLTTFLFNSETEEALGVLQKRILANFNDKQQGLDENIEQDVVISAWNIEDIDWSDLSEEAEMLRGYDPGELFISVLNGGAPPGSAGRTADILKAEEFVEVTAKNAPEQHDESLTIRYGRNLLKVAEDIDALFGEAGYVDASLVLDLDIEGDLVIILGSGLINEVSGESEGNIIEAEDTEIEE